LPKKKLVEEMVQKHSLEPAEVEVDKFSDGNRKPEDGVLPEEG
jgi:phosphoribosylpyrophosphate synthetase